MAKATKCVLVSEEEGCVSEIESQLGADLFTLLKGTATFIGQLPDTDVILMKCDQSQFQLMRNRNPLPFPFHEEVVDGPVLFVRMDEDANPRNFTLQEYRLLASTGTQQ